MKKILVFLTAMVFMINLVVALSISTSLQSTNDASATLSSGKADLYANLITGLTNEARVRIEPTSTFDLDDFMNMSWEVTDATGYAPHVDVYLSTGDVMVFEYAKVDPADCDDVADYPTGDFNTFKDKEIVDDSAYAWLSSGPAGPCGDSTFDANHKSLADWKTDNPVATIDGFEIEIDGWIFESEAMIDNIMINGMLVQDFENSQDVSGDLDDIISIFVNPNLLDFGGIPRGTDITDTDASDVTIDTSGSDTESNSVFVTTDVVGADDAFYEALLEFEISSLWTDVLLALFTIPEDTSEMFGTRLQGDTTIYSSGAKQATIVYTAFGENTLR